MKNMENLKNNINEGPNRTEVRNQKVNRFIDDLTSNTFWDQFEKNDGKYNLETIEKIKQVIRKEIRNMNENYKPNKLRFDPEDIITKQAA